MEGSAKDKKAQTGTISAARRKRINRLKRMIISFVLAAILIPSIACIFMGVQIFSLKSKLKEVEAERNSLLEAMAEESLQQSEELLVEVAQDEQIEETVVIDEENTRKVYLTFDDGPSDNTERILEILDQYGVKATFFVTGEEAVSHPERYQAIVSGGHTIGMHSYSHRYNEIYASEDNFGSDLLMLQEFIEQTTKVTPKFYRFPGGSSNTVSELPMSVFCDYLTDNGITYFDWNISSKDAIRPMRSVEEIVQNCTDDLERFNNAVILLHDAVNKSSTVEALPQVIETIQAMENTEILPITDKTVVIHH